MSGDAVVHRHEIDEGVGWRGVLAVAALAYFAGVGTCWWASETPADMAQSQAAYESEIRALKAEVDDHLDAAQAAADRDVENQAEIDARDAEIEALRAARVRPPEVDWEVEEVSPEVVAAVPVGVVLELENRARVISAQRLYIADLERELSVQEERAEAMRLAIDNLRVGNLELTRAVDLERDRADLAERRERQWRRTSRTRPRVAAVLGVVAGALTIGLLN